MSQVEFRLKQVAAVMLGVTGLARAVAFYRDKLGLMVKEQIPGFAFLDGGGVKLALSKSLFPRCGMDRVGEAAKVVFSGGNVRAAYAALRERGVEFTRLTTRRQLPGPQTSRIPTGTGSRSSAGEEKHSRLARHARRKYLGTAPSALSCYPLARLNACLNSQFSDGWDRCSLRRPIPLPSR